MDNQDTASEKSISTSEEKAEAKSKMQSPTPDDVFDEVFGGPCWTESCPSPRTFFHCLSCTTSIAPPAGPTPIPYIHTHAEPAELENNSPPALSLPIPTTRVTSPPQSLTIPIRRLSPRLTPVRSPVPPSLHTINSSSSSTSGEHLMSHPKSSPNDSYYRSDTSLDLLQVPGSRQSLDSILTSTSSRPSLSVDFKPATITPTNLSPLPKSPTNFFSVYEYDNPVYDGNYLSDGSNNIAAADSINDMNEVLATLDELEEELKELKMETVYSIPVPTPPPPSYFIDRLEQTNEFVRPRIIALQPHCTCQMEHPSLREEIEPIPWVHTSQCKIIRDLYETRTSFYEDTPSRNWYGTMGVPGRAPRSLLNWRVTPEAMTARTCLRLHAQPNIQLVTHLFGQYSGFRGIRITPNEDYIFVAFATDAQSRRARLGLEDLLFSQPHRIHITTVAMDEAIRDIHGFRDFPRSSVTCCFCCKKEH